MTARAGVFEARGLDDAQTRGDILEFLRHGLADRCLAVTARTDLVRLWDIDLDAFPRQRGRQRPPARRGDAAPASGTWPFARVHFDRVGRRTRLVRQLRKREPQLVRTHPFGFLAEEALTQQVELMAERRVLALHAREFVLQGGDQCPCGGEIVDVARGLVRHADMIREDDPPYNSSRQSRDAFIPPTAARVRHIDAGHEQRQIATAHFDRTARLLGWPRERALLQSFVQDPEARAIPRQDFETVSASIPKGKEMARERVERQLLADQRGESINRPPQIGGAGRQISPHGGRERQHAVRKTSSTRRTMSAEALARIRTRSPLAKMTSRSPPPRSALVTTCTGASVTPRDPRRQPRGRPAFA